MSDIINTGLKLFIITVVAAVCMGLTNLATQEPIRLQQIKTANEARQAALPQAEDFSDIEIIPASAEDETSKVVEIKAGKSGNDLVGYTFKVTTRGFGGDMEIIVGINTESEIESIQIGRHQETPGLGAKMKEDSFSDQYHGKQVETPISVSKSAPKDQEIQAITGATITADAVTNGVNLASQYYREVLQDGGGEQ